VIPEWLVLLLIKQKNHNKRFGEFEYFGDSDVVNKLYIFSNQICFLTGKVQKIELNFVFWQVKSMNPFVSVFWQKCKMTCIFVLTWKFKQIYLNLCFNKRNQSDQYLQATYYIFPNKICFWQEKQVQKIDLNFVFWQLKSNKFICIYVLTGKIQQVDLNFCFYQLVHE